MNLIKELEPYNEDLKAWKSNGTIGQSKVQELSVIYEKLRESKPDVGAKVNLSCSSCINDMLKALYNNREEQLKKETVHFKGVPQKEVGHEDLSWADFKKYCTSKGVVTKGKRRVELIKELEEL